MLARAYRLLGTTITVAGDQSEILDWLDEFLSPAFERRDGAAGDLEVVIRTDGMSYKAVHATRPAGELPTAPCFSMHQTVSRRPQWITGGRIVLADEKRDALYVLTGTRVEILASCNSLPFRTTVLRLICELATVRALASRCRLQLHAASLDVHGRTVLLTGEKSSGKTSLLIRLAASTRAAIMSNDRSMLSFSPTGIEVSAVPMTVRIRPWTVECMPELFPTRALVPLQAFLTLAETAAAAGSEPAVDPTAELKVSPAQLAQMLGVPLAARSRLAVVAFPEHHGDPSGVAMTRLTAADAERRLLQMRFGLRSGKTAPTVFERFAAAVHPTEADGALIHELAATVPCFAVAIGARAYGQTETATRVLAALLDAG